MTEDSRDCWRLGLASSVTHWGRYTPDRIAVQIDQESHSYHELSHLTELASMALVRRFCKETLANGIGVSTTDKWELFVMIIACLKAHSHCVLINPLWSREQMEAVVEECHLGIVFAQGPFLSEHSEVVELGEFLSWCANASIDDVHPRSLARPSASTWGILFSSGTTGRPKGIIRSDFSINMELLGWCLELPITRDTVFQVARPLYYTGGLVLTASTILAGGTVLTSSDDQAAHVIEMCREAKPTWVFMIPDQLRDLAKIAALGQPWRAIETRVLTMGSPVGSRLKQSLADLFAYPITESWGNTEGLGTISDDSCWRSRPDSIGRPFLADEITVRRPDGQECAEMEVGRLCGIADSSFVKYQNREDLNDTLRDGETIISEDFGFRDSGGYFYHVGRVTERHVTSDGSVVFTGRIVEDIRALDCVEDIHVVVCSYLNGDQEQHDVVGIAVRKPTELISTEDMCSRINSMLILPHRLTRLVFIDELPRTANGKIDQVRALKLVRRAPPA